MKNIKPRLTLLLFIITCSWIVFFSIPQSGFTAIEWEILKKVPLAEKPVDMVLSPDGSKAFVLGEKYIFILSTKTYKIVDKIPVKEKFSHIAISRDGELLYLTGSKAKQISIMQVSVIYDISTGSSPIIGKKNAPVNIVMFLDYQ